MQSKKSSLEDKLFKVGELERVNRGFFTKVRDENVGLYEVLTTGIGTAKGEISRAMQEKK